MPGNITLAHPLREFGCGNLHPSLRPVPLPFCRFPISCLSPVWRQLTGFNGPAALSWNCAQALSRRKSPISCNCFPPHDAPQSGHAHFPVRPGRGFAPEFRRVERPDPASFPARPLERPPLYLHQSCQRRRLTDTQDAVIFDEPGRRARHTRGDGGDSCAGGSAERIPAHEAALHITALVCGKGSTPA